MPKNSSNLEFEVRDKQLFIRRNGWSDYRITVWPRPNAEGRSPGGNWERFYPEFKLIAYPLSKPKPKPKSKKEEPSMQLDFGLDVPVSKTPTTKKLAYDQLRQTMPISYGMALAPFKSHQWNMIVFLSFHRKFYELIKGNPAIAFLLANRRDFNWRVYRKEIKLEDLVGTKQTELLKLLGLPGTKNLVQITKKVHPSSISLDLIEVLRRLLEREDSVKKLSHLKRINTGVLALLTSRGEIRRHASPQLLEEISASRPNNHYPLAVKELAESLRWHHELCATRVFPKIKTLDALTAYHEEMADASARLLAQADPQSHRGMSVDQLKKLLRQPFQRPPIPGDTKIRPLRSPAELLNEGQRQHNCVSGYPDRVRSGTCYIYHVIAPEPATLSIVRGSGGTWEIGELFAACNQPVKRETRIAVSDWLGNAQIGI